MNEIRINVSDERWHGVVFQLVSVYAIYFVNKVTKISKKYYVVIRVTRSKHSLVSSTIVIFVISTFNIALEFLNLYAILLFIVKSSMQSATEIITNLIDYY